jgi:hypothetical protein
MQLHVSAYTAAIIKLLLNIKHQKFIVQYAIGFSNSPSDYT